jgi:hypothetical protein
MTHGQEPIDFVPPEKIAFIAYNIGVYESVQKFGHLITSGKIRDGSDVPKIAQLLSEDSTFYDAEMISQLINAMLRSYHYQHKRNSNKPTIENVTASEVNYVMKQLKTTGIPLP